MSCAKPSLLHGQLDKFMKKLNQARVCTTPGCRGDLVPIHIRSAGQGGAVTIGYTCNGCVGHTILFETSSRYEQGRISEIGMAVQVAFIIAGCTHITYYNKNVKACAPSSGMTFSPPLRSCYVKIPKTRCDKWTR